MFHNPTSFLVFQASTQRPFPLAWQPPKRDSLRMKILGIDLGAPKTALCVGNETGEIALSRRYPTQRRKGRRLWFQRTLPLLESLLRDAARLGRKLTR
jgi:hypothetical protein